MVTTIHQNLIRAGEIAREAVSYARTIVKKDMLLLELATKIEEKIYELGGKPAFPVNLSINEVAAHATPAYTSDDRAYGLLKVDIGVHVAGAIADTAFSVDLENSDFNKNLIAAAEAGLHAATHLVKVGVTLAALGKAVDTTIRSRGMTTVVNLSGHAIEEYDVHAGVTIPNYDNGDTTRLDEGIYAIEPFATNGAGRVMDGKPSGIYQLMKEGNVRDSFARIVLEFIAEEYRTLPFCSRWIHAKFGTRGLIALRFIEQAGLLHHYKQLIEAGKGIVAQAENTFLVTREETKQIT
ncbi:MAG: type II methionyl aminopeptidase [Nanoarchaeota archaeon]